MIKALQLQPDQLHLGSNSPNGPGKETPLPTGKEGSTGGVADPGGILVTGGTPASFSLAAVAGCLELVVDVPIATPSSSSLGSPRCIPMFLILKPSLPVLTMRVAATAPRLFFISRAGFPFSTLIFPGAPSSACKRSSIPSSTDSPKRTPTGTH